MHELQHLFLLVPYPQYLLALSDIEPFAYFSLIDWTAY